MRLLVRASRTFPALVAALLLVLSPLLASCSGGKDKSSESPTKVLQQAKGNLDSTSGVRIKLSTKKLPAGVNGLLKADGVGTHAPAFDGDIKVSVSGVVADAAVIATGGNVYAKLPFTTKFAKIDPARLRRARPLRPDERRRRAFLAADVGEGREEGGRRP